MRRTKRRRWLVRARWDQETRLAVVKMPVEYLGEILTSAALHCYESQEAHERGSPHWLYAEEVLRFIRGVELLYQGRIDHDHDGAICGGLGGLPKKLRRARVTAIKKERVLLDNLFSEAKKKCGAHAG